jgi:hypothetical protein
MNPLQIAASGVWALGAVFGVLGWLQRRRFRSLLVDGVRSTGTVVEFTSRYDGSHDRYYPVVAFQLADGAPQRAVSRFGSTRPLFAPGQQVPVVYQRDDPERMEILMPGAQAGSNATMAFVATGILAALGGFLLLLPYP